MLNPPELRFPPYVKTKQELEENETRG
jgi:hypothetical protein